MSQGEESCQGEPEFITYLLSPELKHDTYFLVGKEKVERIGAVRKMLAAHSIVFRAELEDSYLKEKGEITVNDIFPDTFRNLLKFVYGHNNIRSLKFEEADDLLYAADKYCMEKMKKQLALQLMPLLNSQNICSLLNNPACHTVLELNAKITEILQWETHDVLASPPFIHLRVEGFVKILEQECLNVPEIQLFRSALAWAKNRDACADGNRLRKQFEELKHIRIRTISSKDFLREVVPSKILTNDEVAKASILYGKGITPPDIGGFSNNTEPRLCTEPLELQILADTKVTTCQLKSVSLRVSTMSSAVGLLPLEIQANSHSSSEHYRCVCNVEIINEYEKAAPITVKFDECVTSGGIFKLPLEKNKKYLKLSPNSSYTITMSFNEPHTIYYGYSCFSNNDLCIRPFRKRMARCKQHGFYFNHTHFPFIKSMKYVRLNTT